MHIYIKSLSCVMDKYNCTQRDLILVRVLMLDRSKAEVVPSSVRRNRLF